MANGQEPSQNGEMIAEILAIEKELAGYEAEDVRRQGKRKRASSLGRRILIQLTLGRRLSRAMGRFLASVRERRGPILGPELAETLDAASKKLIGYKRWMILLALLAALPGIISMTLLWEQNTAVDRSKENVVTDKRIGERMALLQTIYTTYEKTDTGLLTTPVYSWEVRTDSVLRLIEYDTDELERSTEDDAIGLNKMVDLSIAPLDGVDFSRLPGKPHRVFGHVSFNGSNLVGASFERSKFQFVWFFGANLERANFRNAVIEEVRFDGATVAGADFRGATFTECKFGSTRYDASTKWPEGFDPVAAGAVLIAP